MITHCLQIGGIPDLKDGGVQGLNGNIQGTEVQSTKAVVNHLYKEDHSRDYTSSPERGHSEDKKITSSKAKGNRRSSSRDSVSSNRSSRGRHYSDAQTHKNCDGSNKKESESVISNQNSKHTSVSTNCDSSNTVDAGENVFSN